METKTQFDDNQIKLYILLVDQLQKYNSIIWQIPTALIAANSFAFDKFSQDNPVILLGLAAVNFAIIYAYRRMIVQQSAIIDATRKAEDEIRKVYEVFIPCFRMSKIRASSLLAIILDASNSALAIFAFVALAK